MLIGEYLHILDDKKRISLPAKFRKEVGKKVVVTRGLDSCLFMFSLAAWKKIAEKVSDLPVGQAVAVALIVASIKGSLVACYFMHLISEKKLIYSVLLLTAIFFIALLFLPMGTVHDKFGS